MMIYHQGVIEFYLKGAESVMRTRIEPSEWLDEEVDNLARVGLRTLVVAYKTVAESVFGLQVPSG